MSLRVEVLTSDTEVDHLQSEWNTLLATRANTTPFDTLEWIKANLISFPDQKIRVLTFHSRNSGISAILPLVLRHRRKHLRRRNWLEMAGQPYADYGACLIKPGCESEVSESLLDYLDSNNNEWDGVFLDGLRKDDVFTGRLYDSARLRRVSGILHCTHTVRRLDRSVSSTNTHSLQASKSLAKARKRIFQAGEITFEVETAKEEIATRLDGYFRMHIDRCTSKGIVSPFSSPVQQNFISNVVQFCAPSGLVWLSSIYCAGQCIASRFSLRYGAKLHLYSTCLAPEFAKYSPSMLQLENLLEYAFANGIDLVDFGIGDFPQKQKAGGKADCQLARLELYRNREVYLESRIYRAAQRKATQPGAFRTGARLARRLLAYQ